MSICACCGQQLPDAVQQRPESSRLTIEVDDELMACCNLAYEEAARRRAPAVEIAHLVWGLTRGLTASALGLAEESRDALAAEAFSAMAAIRIVNGQSAVKTSAELKSVLRRAEEVAKGETRRSAAPRDVITVLLYRRHGLESAAFLHRCTLARHGTAAVGEAAAAVPHFRANDGVLRETAHLGSIARSTMPANSARAPFERPHELRQFGVARASDSGLSALVYRDREHHASTGAEREVDTSVSRRRFAAATAIPLAVPPDLERHAQRHRETPAGTRHTSQADGPDRAAHAELTDRLARLEWQTREQRALIEDLIEKLARVVGREGTHVASPREMIAERPLREGVGLGNENTVVAARRRGHRRSLRQRKLRLSWMSPMKPIFAPTRKMRRRRRYPSGQSASTSRSTTRL